MNLSLYEITIPVFIHHLQILKKVLEKGERYGKKKRWSQKKLLEAQLAPDMFSLRKQIQYSYFMALEATTILSGREMPKGFAYNEETIENLKKSLAQTVLFLKKIRPNEFEGREKKKVKTFLHSKKQFGIREYALELALPDFFFHVTTAYGILRHLGVSLQKDDYLGLKEEKR